MMKELIEKAEKLDRDATPGSWDTYEDEITAGDNLLFKAGHRSQATASDMLFVSQARTLLPALAAELRRLTELRPIAEAPLGTWVVGNFADAVDVDCRWRVVRSFGHDRWRNHRGEILRHAPTHFLPLPEGPR